MRCPERGKRVTAAALAALCCLVFSPVVQARGTGPSDIWFVKEFRHFRVYPRMDRGYRLYNRGRLEEARGCFEQALEIDPSCVEARHMLLEISLKEGDGAGLAEQARALSARDPASPLAGYYRAKWAALRGDSRAAAEQGRHALEREGLTSAQEREMLTLIVAHHKESGTPEELEAYLDDSCEAPADPALAQFCLEQKIDLYLINRDIEKARAAYETYEGTFGRADEKHFVYWAHVLAQQGDPASAYWVASRLPPQGKHLELQVNLLNDLGRHGEAADRLKAHAGPDDKATADYWVQLATLYHLSGDVDAEFEALCGGIKEVRDDAVLYEMLADRLIAMKSYNDAIPVLEAHLALTGDDRSREKLAILHASDQDYPSAIAMTRQLVEGTGVEERRRVYLKQLVDYLAKDGDLERIAAIYRAELANGVAYHDFALPAGLTRGTRVDRKIAMLKAGYPYGSLPRKYRVELMIALATLCTHANDPAGAREVVNGAVHETPLENDEIQRLASLAHALDECALAVDLSRRLLEGGAGTVDACLTAGYCLQKMGKPGLAAFYFEKARSMEPGPDPAAAYHMDKSLGYLYAELEQPDTALGYWERCLAVEFEPGLAVSAAELAAGVGRTQRAAHWLERVDPGSLTPERRSAYWALIAGGQERAGDLHQAGTSYLLALAAHEGEQLWYLYARNQRAQGQHARAEEAMKQLIALAPDNGRWHAELGYLYLEQGRFADASVAFDGAVARCPDDCRLLEALAQAETGRGMTEQAVTALERALFCSEGQGPARESSAEDAYRLKRAMGLLEKRWAVSVAESARLNGGAPPRLGPLAKNSGYSGFGSVEAAYRPALFSFGAARYLQVFGRFLWNNKDKGFRPVSDSLQGSAGVRFKPLAEYAVFVSLEKLWDVGDTARDDWMARLSGSVSGGLEWRPSAEGWLFQNLYLDAVYLFDTEAGYLTCNYEWGRFYKMPLHRVDAALAPYLVGGGSWNNDNAEARSDTLVDVGAGVSLFSWHGESKTRAHRLRNRVSLEGRIKVAGNKDDSEALLMKCEAMF